MVEAVLDPAEVAREAEVPVGVGLGDELAVGRGVLAMHVEDYDFAVSIMNQAGFKLIYQEDLSR